ncbi:hypothetical protein AVEN_70838-1 [Araneus ventricosus]|uniref:Uncharacterized protein n=1 Tax=Araneus ventricosus TaxID=182803 RepID=A0A4Y2HIP6_ARAVE|nr:hypothetical protein AVEN_70838-1 [Araneus ventricosus]
MLSSQKPMHSSQKPLCPVSYGYIAQESGQLKGSKDRCEVNHVSLREHGMHFLPCTPIQLTGNPLDSELGGSTEKGGLQTYSDLSAEMCRSSAVLEPKMVIPGHKNSISGRRRNCFTCVRLTTLSNGSGRHLSTYVILDS